MHYEELVRYGKPECVTVAKVAQNKREKNNVVDNDDKWRSRFFVNTSDDDVLMKTQYNQANKGT